MSVDNKQFMGYAKVVSNIRHVKSIPALSSLVHTHRDSEDPGYAFKIKWFSKNRVAFDLIRFIRNSHNSNNSINMCKEFNVNFTRKSTSSRRTCFSKSFGTRIPPPSLD